MYGQGWLRIFIDLTEAYASRVERRTLLNVANFDSTSVLVNMDSKLTEFEARAAVNSEGS